MDDKEQELYWRGVYFPGTLTVEELEKWCEIKNRTERAPTEQEQTFWGHLFFLYAAVLCALAFIL
jgi:hypothetical protein